MIPDPDNPPLRAVHGLEGLQRVLLDAPPRIDTDGHAEDTLTVADDPLSLVEPIGTLRAGTPVIKILNLGVVVEHTP